MKITSLAFTANNSIPSKYTCDSEDQNPPFEFSDIPDDAKSLALIVDDPDAPRGNWVHWIIYNIPPNQSKIAENTVPVGAQLGLNDFGRTSWGGPCPPSGEHHYHFKLFALDTVLKFSSSPEKNDLEKAMEGHVIERSILIGLYKRK